MRPIYSRVRVAFLVVLVALPFAGLASRQAIQLLTVELAAQQPAIPNKVESPTVTALTGLTVRQFEQEMQHFVQALGVSCGGCHLPKGNFASDDNARKVKSRQMIEMTKALNKQYFPDHTPGPEESVLGRISCYTCHRGELKPKTTP
jgi:Photosynthetic reaction centre cytochrome C subunit